MLRASGEIAMRFWDKRDLPFTYSLARHFPIGERYFCSVLGQTYPNRRFFFAGTASGTINDQTNRSATHVLDASSALTAQAGTLQNAVDEFLERVAAA